jgi:hypothetical protein
MLAWPQLELRFITNWELHKTSTSEQRRESWNWRQLPIMLLRSERAEAAFAADVAAVIKAGGNIADSVLINEAHVKVHRAQAAEAKRRDESVTAQAAGALARCDDVWMTAYPN